MSGGWLARFRKDAHGASAVEFALVIGPLLLIFFGTFEFGRMYWTQNAIQVAAISGARCMGVRQSECASGGTLDQARTVAFIRQTAGGYAVSVPDSAISLQTDTSCAGVPGFSSVTISQTFETALPELILALSEGRQLQATACFPNV